MSPLRAGSATTGTGRARCAARRRRPRPAVVTASREERATHEDGDGRSSTTGGGARVSDGTAQCVGHSMPGVRCRLPPRGRGWRPARTASRGRRCARSPARDEVGVEAADDRARCGGRRRTARRRSACTRRTVSAAAPRAEQLADDRRDLLVVRAHATAHQAVERRRRVDQLVGHEARDPGRAPGIEQAREERRHVDAQALLGRVGAVVGAAALRARRAARRTRRRRRRAPACRRSGSARPRCWRRRAGRCAGWSRRGSRPPRRPRPRPRAAAAASAPIGRFAS